MPKAVRLETLAERRFEEIGTLRGMSAKDAEGSGRDGPIREGKSLFPAMPPLEVKKLFFRMSAKEQRVWRRGRWERRKLMFMDVKKSHLNGQVLDGEFALDKLPDCKTWRLKRWLHNMSPAAQAWEEENASQMVSIGLARGKSNTTVFHQQSTGCRCVVHGGGFTSLCCGCHAEEVVGKMGEWYGLKVRAAVGDDDGDDKEVTILKRTFKHTGHGPECSADPRNDREVRAGFNSGCESNVSSALAAKEEGPLRI